MIADDLLSRLRDGKPKPGGGYMFSCPVPGHAHGDRNRSLSADVHDGKLLLYCFAGHDFEQVIGALGGGAATHKVVPLMPRLKAVKPAEQAAYVRRVWRESRRADGTLVEKYLRSRGITIPVPYSLRFHPRLRHTPSNSYWPAMIAAVVSIDRKLTAIHRTYLSPDGTGKAQIESNKMGLGPIKGGAVWLGGGRDIPDKLAVTEGIETGLSILQATGIPTWATLGTEFMKAVIVPPQVREVIICADGDEPGEAAAQALAARLVSEKGSEGRVVKIARPPKGLDFNDVLMGLRTVRDEGRA